MSSLAWEQALFFFSSRRRHTRLTCDWSSDVCSSDLAWEELHSATTRVTFRELTPRDLGHYLASREWEGRAGAYAIQGLGAVLVERIEGDYLNVVGLPGALLVKLLAKFFPGTYGFG